MPAMVSTSPIPQPRGGPILKKTSTPRRPALVQKRSGSAAGMDEDLPSSPLKRMRVQFSQDVEVRTTDEFDKPMDIVREEVSRALESHKTLGDSTEYLQLKNCFTGKVNTRDASDLSSRQKLLVALARNAASLNKSCGSLVSAVINSEWISYGGGYVNDFQRLLLCLVSARSAWIGEILQMLMHKLSNPMPACAPTELTRQEAQFRIHETIRQIVKLCPLDGTSSLRLMLSKAFPAHWDSTKKHVLYVHNVLKITEYASELEADVLATITDKLVKLDVQVQTDIEDLDDLDELLVAYETDTSDAFMDNLEDDDDDDDDSDDDDDDMSNGRLDTNGHSQNGEAKAKAVRKEIQKMDLMMDVAFDHYDRLLNGTFDGQERVYNLLESQFDTIVLPAYRSRHTQFILFHHAQSSPETIDRFVGTCLLRAMDKGRAALLRQSAAAYLGSFVARGAHVPAQVVRDAFAYIADELAELRRSHEAVAQGPDLRRFGTYYALFQALLYIFCFRWRDLETTPSDAGSPYSSYYDSALPGDSTRHIFMQGVKEAFDQNVISKLNPLKVCSPIIVEESAKLAHRLGLSFMFPIIESNKRLRLVQTNLSILERESALSVRRDEGLFQLDGYFPFDPYHLPRSKRWLKGDYRQWEPLPGTEGDDEGSSGDESEEEDDDHADSGSEDEGAA